MPPVPQLVVIATVVWLTVSAITSLILMWELWQVVLDARYIDSMGWNGPMHIVISRDLRTGALRLTITVAYVIFGVVLLSDPYSSMSRISLAACMSWTAISTFINTYIDRRNRHFVALAEGHHEDYLPSARRVGSKTAPPRGED